MEFQGTVAIAAKQTAVWHILTTPTIISQCTPLLQSWVNSDTNTQFQLQLAWGSGSNTVIIPLSLTWQTVTPPTLLQWQGQAQLGSTTLPLQGNFTLNTSDTNQTNLTFSAQLTPPNKLLGQMIQTAAPRFIESFFRCLKTTAETV
jgi:carbon monoxide dehydrogenase subunit G